MSEVCAYCGENAECRDHVIPRSYLSSARRSNRPGNEPGFRVPSCRQCNSILGSRVFPNIVERKQYVFNKLYKKLKKYAAVVQWDEQELEELGPNLRHCAEVHMAKCQVARERLAYAAAPPDEKFLKMELRWRAGYGDY